MKFRYFIVNGASRQAYLDFEKKEHDQRVAINKVMFEERNDIESYRPGRSGGVLSVTFKPGMQPPGMVRASRDLPESEVRPHAKSKDAAPMREFFEKLRVTENCQESFRKLLSLPSLVVGMHSGSPSGLAGYSSRVGHVGENIVAEVPDAEVSDSGHIHEKFTPHEDLKEIEFWEYAKLHADNKNFSYGGVYVLGMRD